MIRTLLLPFLVLVMAACANQNGGPVAAQDSPAGAVGADGAEDASGVAPGIQGEWVLQSASSSAAAIDDGPVAVPTLVVDADGVRGHAGCNSYSGSFGEPDGPWLGVVQSTRKGCAPDIMAAERAYLDALGAVTGWTPGDGVLTLTGDGIELAFRAA